MLISISKIVIIPLCFTWCHQFRENALSKADGYLAAKVRKGTKSKHYTSHPPTFLLLRRRIGNECIEKLLPDFFYHERKEELLSLLSRRPDFYGGESGLHLNTRGREKSRSLEQNPHPVLDLVLLLVLLLLAGLVYLSSHPVSSHYTSSSAKGNLHSIRIMHILAPTTTTTTTPLLPTNLHHHEEESRFADL